jgi:hypothetical protein
METYNIEGFVVDIFQDGTETFINIFKDGKIVEHIKLHEGHFMETRSGKRIAEYAVKRYLEDKTPAV